MGRGPGQGLQRADLGHRQAGRDHGRTGATAAEADVLEDVALEMRGQLLRQGTARERAGFVPASN